MLVFAPDILAQTRVLVLRDESAATRQAAELLMRELPRLGWVGQEVAVDAEGGEASLSMADTTVVALGHGALRFAGRQGDGRTLVGALVSRASVEQLLPFGVGHWSVVVLDQPAERWANLIVEAFPSARQIGMLVGRSSQRQARLIERRLQDRRRLLTVETVPSEGEVIPALSRLLPRSDVLLTLPDPAVHNRNTVQPILLTTYRSGIPVVAYSEAYLQAGSAVALYSTLPQVVAQVLETLQQFAEGRPPVAIQSPRHFTVGVNAVVARALGLALPSGGELQQRLRNADQ